MEPIRKALRSALALSLILTFCLPVGGAMLGVGLGFVADRYGWNSIYAVILVFAVLGLLTLMTIWKAAPDGYAAAEKFTAEYGKISNR